MTSARRASAQPAESHSDQEMTKIEIYDVVRLRAARDEVDTSTRGAVVMVYDVTPPEYEVEFCDDEGGTVALLTLREDELVKVEPSENEQEVKP